MKVWLRAAAVAAAVLLGGGIVYEHVRAATDVPGFTASDLNGTAWALEQHRGHPVLISFFATDCGPCTAERPHLLQLRRKYTDLEVVFLSRESTAQIRPVPGWGDLAVPVLAEAGPVFDSYHVEGTPHHVLFDAEGKPVLTAEGFSPDTIPDLERKLAKLAGVR